MVRLFTLAFAAIMPELMQCFMHQSGSGASLSISLKKKLTKARNTDGKAKANHKLAYYGNVAVGSNSQTFQVVFDTGSGNLIIPGEDCKSSACTIHERWNYKSSTTAKAVNCDGSNPGSMLPDQITITFGTGEITGDCYSDRICVGSACTTGDLIVSTEESAQPFASFGFDGVLGLARTSMAQADSFSMMSRFHAASSLRQSIFSVFLSDSEDEVSEVTFGTYKQEHMAPGSDIFWVDVTPTSGYWEVKIDDITFDGEPQGICENCKVAVDTGTSMLAGPTDVINKLNSKLNVERGCGNYATLPKLGFIVDGVILSLSPKEYVNNVGGYSCTGTLMNLDVPPPKGPLFIFGIPFLQKYYTVYDHINGRVGFAVAKHQGETAEAMVMVGNSTRAGKAQPNSFLQSRKR